jgi:hypothetical protein
MIRHKGYIASPDYFKEMYRRYSDYFRVIEEFPIGDIKFDKQYLGYPNEINHGEVIEMLVNFDKELWGPIHLNKDNFLLDGQHRLQVAKQLCLKYIDVIVCEED